MKIDSEKEKKLSFALNKLKSLNLKNPTLMSNLENLSTQKNQLESEKKEIEKKYGELIRERGWGEEDERERQRGKKEGWKRRGGEGKKGR